MKRIPSILILMFVPQIAFAFMDAPTVTATFPSYLLVLVPLIACEVAYLSSKLNVTMPNVLKAGILTHLLALVVMILGGWLQADARLKLIEFIDYKTVGITFFQDSPSAFDYIFSLSIGSVVLIQVNGYRWLNSIVIIVFLLPTFLLSTYLGIKLFNRFLPNVDRTRLTSALIQIKGIEYGSVVIASFVYLNFVYKL